MHVLRLCMKYMHEKKDVIIFKRLRYLEEHFKFSIKKKEKGKIYNHIGRFKELREKG